MTFTATQIAVLINGKIEGNPDSAVSSFGRIEEAQEGQLGFFSQSQIRRIIYTQPMHQLLLLAKNLN